MPVKISDIQAAAKPAEEKILSALRAHPGEALSYGELFGTVEGMSLELGELVLAISQIQPGSEKTKSLDAALTKLLTGNKIVEASFKGGRVFYLINEAIDV